MLSRRHIGQLSVLLASSYFSAAASASDRLSVPPLPEGKRRLYLARHGETDWNVQRRIQGNTDRPLDEKGRRQAEALSLFMASAPLDLVASSTLSRAKDTAGAVASRHGEVARVSDKRFSEMCFGSLEGQVLVGDPPRYDGTPAYADTLRAWDTGETSVRWPGGESADEVAARGLAGLKDLGVLGVASATSPRHTLLVAHSRFNKIVISALQGDISRCNTLVQGNTCLNVLDIDRDGAVEVIALNIQDHLALDPALAVAA